ncbi:MAG TPA: Smr/MutS family protein [Rhizobiaceae bacterium]|nr:Smr/MutS family protein [Rhizobiaceae bacterium]
MSRRARELTEEDRVLWHLVARSTKPLAGKEAIAPPPELPAREEPALPAPRSEAQQGPSPRPKSLKIAHVFDAQTREKLAKGRLPIEGRVDLHGMTQDEAYWLLLSFLRRAQQGGVRYVLIITGKGSSSRGEGVLRRSVPQWLATPPFRALVSGHDDASRRHGGGGALYVRVRRAAG